MNDLETICPVCENDIIVSPRDVLMAVRHKQSTGGRALVGCPVCNRSLVLPEGMPEGAVELGAWLGYIEDVTCVPLLNDSDVRLPAGVIDNLGKKTYRPGGGGPALMKRPYMLKYGIDPEKAWAKMTFGEDPFMICQGKPTKGPMGLGP